MRSAIFAEMSSKTPGATTRRGSRRRAARASRRSGFTLADLQGDEHGGQRRRGQVDDAGAGEGVRRDEQDEAANAEQTALRGRQLGEEKTADRRRHEPDAGD